MRDDFRTLNPGTKIELLSDTPKKLGLLVDFLKSVDSDFPISLSSKVDLREYAQKLLSRGDSVAAVNEAGEILALAAGYATNSIRGISYISVVATSSSQRGKGLASKVVRSFLDLAKEKGCYCAHLYTDQSNLGAISMYQKLGFFNIYPDKEQRPDDIHLCFVLRGGCEKEYWLDDDHPNILLTSAGRRAYLVDYFKNAMAGRGEVHASNSTSLSAALARADKAVVSPLIYSNDYISFLVNYCEKNGIGALLPLFDIDVPVLAENSDKLRSAGCLPVVANSRVAKICNDKLLTASCLSVLGAHTPCTVAKLEECLAAISEGKMAYPIIVKPRWGMGSMSVYVAHSEEELRVVSGMAKRGVNDSYLKYESGADEERALVFQQCLKGDEYGMDVMNSLTGEYVGCVVKKKIAMRAGETDCAEVLANPPAELERLAKTLSLAFRHPGNMDVDLFFDGDTWSVIELNARFGGGYPFSHAAGANLVGPLVAWLRGEPCSNGVFVQSPGVYQKDIQITKLFA